MKCPRCPWDEKGVPSACAREACGLTIYVLDYLNGVKRRHGAPLIRELPKYDELPEMKPKPAKRRLELEHDA